MCQLTVNIDGQIGAVGFLPIWLSNIVPLKIIKVDEDGNPIRNPKTGLCIRCGPNEAGELVGMIKKNHPISDFEGYLYIFQELPFVLFELYFHSFLQLRRPEFFQG